MKKEFIKNKNLTGMVRELVEQNKCEGEQNNEWYTEELQHIVRSDWNKQY